ncbi:MAG: S41 family peptidase [bacterium]
MKVKNIIALALTIIISFTFISNESRVTDVLAGSDNFYSKIKIFTSILETIHRAYVDEREPDELLDDAIKGVLKNLDPHTVYLPVDEFKSWNRSFEGYTGIGISFEVLNGKAVVISVIDGSPADRAGIQPGDTIIQIAGKKIDGLRREEITSRLLGPVGISVQVRILNNQSKKKRDLVLTRQRIKLESIPFALMLRPDIGYVKIERFAASTSRELENALNSLEAQGMRSLVLDLRGNSGGYLNAAIEVADKFIPGGNKIVSTKGRLASSWQEYYSTSRTHNLYPLIVLIDHGAASASEIVAGAIQDLDRGLILGKTSFGKGLVQSQYRFQDGSALLITTARYYTPSGRPIQRNYFDKSKEEYYEDAYDDAFLKSTRFHNQKPKYRTLTGRTVYAGGGIEPDIWIENDENILSANLRELYFSDERLFFEFADDFLKKNPGLRKNSQFFVNSFLITESIYQNFVHFVRHSTTKFSQMAFDVDKENIKFLLKREMAYLVGGPEARFRINLQRDKQLNEALNHFGEAHELVTLAYTYGAARVQY